jgi:hypothetical protein
VGFISLDQARAHLNITRPGSDDTEIERFVEAACEVVEGHVGQLLTVRPVTETHVIAEDGTVMVRADPVRSVVSARRVTGEPVDSSGIEVRPYGVLYCPGLVGEVEFTVLAGRSDVPSRYTAAGLMIVGHLWRSQRVTTVGASFAEDQFVSPWGAGFSVPNAALDLLGGKAPNLP